MPARGSQEYVWFTEQVVGSGLMATVYRARHKVIVYFKIVNNQSFKKKLNVSLGVVCRVIFLCISLDDILLSKC